MNQHLQNIWDIIQQDENLSADQKSAIIQSLKDADKELEIVSFKLDRTDKVKRTTAILLEETIEELEQRRKAVEAQNRELEIEAALERIRSKVTAMQESSDLLDIVVTMRREFLALGHNADYFWYMRYLPEIYEKAMTSGDGTRIGMVMTLPRHIHGDIKMVADWEESGEPTLVFPMDVETAVEYIHKMITLGDFKQVDPNAPTLDDIRHIGGLTFVMARTTHGEIGYSLAGVVTDPPKEDLATLARFAAVFDLAYRRFEDLQSAEKRNRETQIELALERTRSRSMLMNHSGELKEISKIFHQQLLLLGIDSEFSFVWLPDEDKQEHMFWATWVSEENGISIYNSKAINYPLDKTEPGTAACYAAWESGQAVHETYVPPAEIVAFFAVWEELLRGAEQFKPELFPEGIFYTEAYMKYGCFGIDIRRQLTDDEKEVIRRFAVEFERTYTRFLDLKKAEAQALQAEQDLIAIKEARRNAEEALTELKATQSQLIQSEKMASLGELTAGIAHEIQNPLNFVNNFAEVSIELIDEMIEQSAVGGQQSAVVGQQSAVGGQQSAVGSWQLAKEIADDIKNNLEKIQHHGKRADAIVKGMLQHSRTSSGVKEPTDINALCDEYLRLAYHGLRAKDKSFNADFKTDFDEDLPKINVIPQDFGRVLLNLINNAFYAVTKGDLTGDLTGPLSRNPTVTIATRKTGEMVEISVKDNGPGIPDEIKDKIFQPFFTTKPTGEGTGLGLSLSYDIVTKGHGGELKVNSKEGEGTEFIIFLPITNLTNI